MSHSMERKRWLRRQGMCTQCGSVPTSNWRCPGCSAKQGAHARARREAKKHRFPHANAEAHSRMMEWLSRASSAEVMALSVKAGVYNPDGTLTEEHGGPVRKTTESQMPQTFVPQRGT